METKIKNLVKSAVLGVAVLGGAVALQSFTEEKSTLFATKANENFEYWDFVGSSTGPNDPLDANQYQLATGPEDCPGSAIVCQIQAPIAPGSTPHPDLDAETTPSRTVHDEVESALTSGDNDYVSMKNN